MNYNYERGTYRNNRNAQSKAMYVHGSAAPKYDIPGQLEEPRRGLSEETRKNREKAKYMSLGYVSFLIVALVVAGVVLIGYIRLQADITALSGEITRQEKLISNMMIENEEAWSRLAVIEDLDEIKRVAVQELGMIYPKEGQIVSYGAVGYDYVRKVSDGN